VPHPSENHRAPLFEVESLMPLLPRPGAALSHVATATALLFTAACVDRYTVAPVQLEYLNGYDIHTEQTVQGATFTDKPYRLTTLNGEAVDYNSSKQLLLLGTNGKPLAPPGPFELISISDDTFDAKPLVGQAVEVPLERITRVEVQQANPEKTRDVLLAVSAVLGLVAAVLGVVAAASAHSSSASSMAVPTNSALK
jgi:hypothetical protein